MCTVVRRYVKADDYRIPPERNRSVLERRYRVLQLIFEDKQHSQLQTLGIDEVASRIGASRDSIWDDVNYLRDKGLIVINERQIGTRVYFTFDITSTGIDAAEGLAALTHYQRPADGAETTLTNTTPHLPKSLSS